MYMEFGDADELSYYKAQQKQLSLDYNPFVGKDVTLPSAFDVGELLLVWAGDRVD